ncbi:MAG TPA: prephenate dehydrogenase dimerization domain-containing protein [Nitrososphaera sp.]|jgi:prephenate dehydrogenase|nr:prephenate dehydrogenase dimerization domain-containing protein [Nitrososphaera sp.]
MLTQSSTLKSLLILGSSGKLGSILSKKLKESGYYVIGLDTKQSPSHEVDLFLQADIADPDALSILSSHDFDALIIVVPSSMNEIVVNNVVIPYGKDRLIIDLLSEKYGFEQLINRAVDGVEHIGAHLLFAPTVRWEGQNVLVTPRNIVDIRALKFIHQLEAWGSVVHYCDPIEHDQLMGLIQVTTHAAIISYAQLLVNQQFDFKLLNAVSTPASRVMWAMIARMISNDPSVYWEIQINNIFAQDARSQVADSIRKLDEFVRNGDKRSFDTIFDKLKSMFNSDLEEYKQLADELYNHKIQKDK